MVPLSPFLHTSPPSLSPGPNPPPVFLQKRGGLPEISTEHWVTKSHIKTRHISRLDKESQ